MKHWSTRIVVGFLGAACACGAAMAKLPAPAEPTEDAKAAAVAAAAKTAWGSKVAGFKLCLAQDKAVAHYLESARSAGKVVTPATPTPDCADPGPYVAAANEPAKPIEAAGAHSPAATAVGPPSTLQPDAEANPAKKP